tara:strand:+ start:170 stop:547 length:378 start_codon:yes stop_codon:yes gene_type:complete
MSTHSTLGVKMEDGSVMGCYVHYDGHSMKPRIEQFLKDHTTTDLVMLIARAQSTGGMRGFHCAGDIDEVPVTDFLEDNEPYVIDQTNFYKDHMGTYAWYLVDYNNSTIEVKNAYTDEDDNRKYDY